MTGLTQALTLERPGQFKEDTAALECGCNALRSGAAVHSERGFVGACVRLLVCNQLLARTGVYTATAAWRAPVRATHWPDG
jgi:hypothetical protein